MAPLNEQAIGLIKRDDGCGDGWYRGYDGFCYRYYSSWYWWGRWVIVGLAILFMLIVVSWLVRNSRRRRRQGLQPMYGTGWMAPAPAYYPPPPLYSREDPGAGQPPPPGGYKYGHGEGYYGGNQEGIQLQPPANTYHRGPEPDYAPPPGPPPNTGK